MSLQDNVAKTLIADIRCLVSGQAQETSYQPPSTQETYPEDPQSTPFQQFSTGQWDLNPTGHGRPTRRLQSPQKPSFEEVDVHIDRHVLCEHSALKPTISDTTQQRPKVPAVGNNGTGWGTKMFRPPLTKLHIAIPRKWATLDVRVIECGWTGATARCECCHHWPHGSIKGIQDTGKIWKKWNNAAL